MLTSNSSDGYDLKHCDGGNLTHRCLGISNTVGENSLTEIHVTSGNYNRA